MNEPGIYAHLVDEDAKDVLVLDSSTFINEIGLTSQKGSALKHYLYQRGTQLAVPAVAAEEYERNLIGLVHEKIENIQKELRWLAQFFHGIKGWSAPDHDDIEHRAKALAACKELGAVVLSGSDDVTKRARRRDRDRHPPSHHKSSIGDCTIWEQCLDLLLSHDVVFVSADKDFRLNRNTSELHPVLREEAREAESGRTLTFHSGMESLLAELKSEIPSIPDDAIFEFLYRELDDEVQEVQSDYGCHPASSGKINQELFTTDAPELIEVRLEVEDRWRSCDGFDVLSFQLTGTCQYHLREDRLVGLKGYDCAFRRSRSPNPVPSRSPSPVKPITCRSEATRGFDYAVQ